MVTVSVGLDVGLGKIFMSFLSVLDNKTDENLQKD